MTLGAALKRWTGHVQRRGTPTVHFDMGSSITLCGVDTLQSRYVFDDTRKAVTCRRCRAALRRNEEEVRRNRRAG